MAHEFRQQRASLKSAELLGDIVDLLIETTIKTKASGDALLVRQIAEKLVVTEAAVRRAIDDGSDWRIASRSGHLGPRTRRYWYATRAALADRIRMLEEEIESQEQLAIDDRREERT